ncbi:MAG: hypothetical protein WKF75_05470 [Singulisphaera sp.]
MTPLLSGPDFERLVARVRDGDEAAWARLSQASYPRVFRVEGRAFTRPMRWLYDPADFAGDVLRHFAAEYGQLDFPSPDAMIAHLESLVAEERRRMHKRGDAAP